jgi:hypothetical protein
MNDVKKYNFHPPKKILNKICVFLRGNGAQNGIICRPLISWRKKKALEQFQNLKLHRPTVNNLARRKRVQEFEGRLTVNLARTKALLVMGHPHRRRKATADHEQRKLHTTKAEAYRLKF